MIYRKEIRTLNSQELLDLRKAMIIFQDINPKMYYEIAGYHGEPKKFCPHGEPILFLAWHRYYIYFFEQELQKINPDLSLPYWNWTDENTFHDSIAPAHNDKKFKDNDGVEKHNPLYSALINNGARQTQRDGRLLTPDRLTDIAKNVKLAIELCKTLSDLGAALFSTHQSIHEIVGLDFGTCPQAAYDPLFWSHHATVDRQWAIWQDKNPGYKVQVSQLNRDFNNLGFPGKTVGDVINYKDQLGYCYDNLNFVSDANYKPVVLNIENILATEDAFSIDVYLINHGTGQKVKANYFGIFGMGKMPVGHGMHHQQTFNEYLDITEAVTKLGINPKNINPKTDIYFGVHDQSGNKANPHTLQFDSISIA